MEDNKPRYIVTLSDGNAFQLTEQEYKSREDGIFGKDKGATVARINDYSIDDDIDDNAAYTVTSGDNTFLLSADEYKSRRDKIRGMDGVRVGSLSHIDYWGDKLNAITEEIAQLNPQLESALAAYNDPANSWDFTDEDMDISAATEAAKRS
jgi:NAD kinase